MVIGVPFQPGAFWEHARPDLLHHRPLRRQTHLYVRLQIRAGRNDEDELSLVKHSGANGSLKDFNLIGRLIISLIDQSADQ